MHSPSWTGTSSHSVAADSSLVALAEAVDRLDLKRPIMHEKPVLKIRNGFHPLQAMCLEQGQYIHNDTMVEGGAGGDFSPVVSVENDGC